MITAAFHSARTLAGTASPLAQKMGQLRRRLRRDCSGLAMVEFAFTAPIVLGLGMLGTETAYFFITHMQISQVAMQVADNTSRVGEQDVLTARRVFESDINESFIGAEKAAEGINLFGQGRMIVSSLQRNAQGGQWIAWQRCRGARVHTSSFGIEGNGATGTGFAGMGEPGRQITAAAGTAVMFVEVSYIYDSLTPFDLYDGREITYTAAFNIRDNRDLTGGPASNGLHNDNPPAPVARCNVFSAGRPT